MFKKNQKTTTTTKQQKTHAQDDQLNYGKRLMLLITMCSWHRKTNVKHDLICAVTSYTHTESGVSLPTFRKHPIKTAFSMLLLAVPVITNWQSMTI